jgi:manganese/zinc/iron transport system substrate-binding protein
MCGCALDNPHTGGSADWKSRNGKVKVLTTIAMIDDLVRQVGGDAVDTMPLISGDLDPHSYQLVKGDDEKLAFADLIFYNGLGLEHGPSLQESLRKSNKAVALGDKIMEADPELLLYYKGQPDPHIWMDVSLWAKIVPIIVTSLSEKDPAHAEEYHRNGEKVLAEMMQAHEQNKAVLHSIPDHKRYLVTSHDAFNYFTRAYLSKEGESEQEWSQRFAAPEGLAPESQISTTDIQAIVDHLSRHHIRVIFPESNINRDSIRKIVEASRKKGLEVEIADTPLYSDAMGRPGSDGDTYLKMVSHNARTIASKLINNGKDD